MNIPKFVAGCVMFTVCTGGLRAATTDTTAVASGMTAATSGSALTCITDVTADTAAESSPVFEGTVYTEVNYGRGFGGADRSRRDFPHVVAAATCVLGRGWTLEAEIEYERMHENGEWCNDHWDNFTTNKLYADKRWSEALGLKFGIVDVPLGITNGGGPALTIYDPVSEAALMPMTWHETGAALHGRAGQWSYELSALAYVTSPVSACRTLGLAAAARWTAPCGLSVGAGAFGGRASGGCLRRCSPDFIDGGGLAYGVADAVYEGGGWTACGSVIYCNRGNARSAGIEAGYDVMSTTAVRGCSLTPFVRYDGVYGLGDDSLDRLTGGVCLTLFDALTVKVEYGSCRHAGRPAERTLDAGVGYELKF